MPSVVTMTGPGTATVTDDAFTAITVQNRLLTFELNRIFAALSQINNTLNRIHDRSLSSSKSLSDLNIALGSLATATASSNALAAAAAASQIRTNNFQMQVTLDALKRTGQAPPVLPGLDEQMAQAIKDGLTMNAAAKTTGAIETFITDQIAAIGRWLAGTEIYKGVSAWLSEQKDLILAAALPASPTGQVSNTLTISGVPTIPGNVG